MSKKEIEKIIHHKKLLDNCIDYLWEIWNNESLEDIKKGFEKLGFNDEDLEDFGILEEINYLKEEL